MLSILHVSDIHLGPPFRPQAAKALVKIASTLGADVLVASGDFTQRAKEQQFKDARALLDSLPQLPTVMVPGNHDVPLYRLFERLLKPNALYREHIHPELEMTVTVDGAVLVGINTTAPHLTVTRGRLRQSSIDFAARAFAQAPEGAARILVAHHQFIPAPDALRDGPLLGGKRGLARFAELGVDLILGGHLHRAYVGDSRDFLVEEPIEHAVFTIHSGTTTSRRGRGREKTRNSFNLIHMHGDRIEVNNYLYLEHEDIFAPVSQRILLRPGHRHLL